MRCSNRSTPSSSNGVVTLAGMMVMLWVGTTAAASDQTQRVEQAIADAVRARIGEAAEVHVTVGQVRLPDDEIAALEARPVSGARLGRRTRFTLYLPPAAPNQKAQRVGYAVAEAHATLEHVQTARPISRGVVLTAEDVVVTTADVGRVPLAPLPTIDEVLGATLSRPLKAGVLIGRTAIRLPMLVRTGDLVVTRVQVGAVVVAGRTTATESGQLGEVIGLLNEQSGRRLRGRVVAQGEVEVVY